jgi:hypothetical protein
MTNGRPRAPRKKLKERKPKKATRSRMCPKCTSKDRPQGRSEAEGPEAKPEG